MALLIAGLIIFLGVHSVRIFANDWRTAQIAKIGPRVWKGGYALLSLIGFVLIVYGYGLARQTPVVLYTTPAWTRHAAALLTLVAFVMIAAAYVPETHIKARIRHPMIAGVKVWAVAHLLANGTLADVILFGSFLAWAILNYSAALRRDRAANVGYVVGRMSRDMTAVAIGAITWVVFTFWLHAWWIGVRPLG
ncbi:MAG: NnrU family protein [Burkholderiaceae bacterium]